MVTRKQLYRSTSDRFIAGVCGGIADYLEIDSTIVRLIALVLVLAGGGGLLAYIIAWIVVPVEPTNTLEDAPMATDTDKNQPVAADTEPHGRHRDRHRGRSVATPYGRTLAGFMLVVVGGLFLIQDVYGFDVWHYGWPILLIVVGLVMALARS